ncbi:MAG: ankyrin repeat domain-containing protein [Elusimicrobia bacterium]|nr:ankyrin repeat domain-containing protein [Elusimicrobiota bacterium]
MFRRPDNGETGRLLACLGLFLLLLSPPAGAASLDARLVKSVTRGDSAKTLSLLKAGANPNSLNEWGVCVLLLAAGKTAGTHTAAEHQAIVDALYRSGAQLGRVFRAPWTQLARGAAEYLLSACARNAPEAGSCEGGVAIAARYGIIEQARLFLERGASPDESDDEGQTALVLAAAGNHSELAKLLLESGAKADTAVLRQSTRQAMATPLAFAAYHQNLEIAHRVISGGASSNLARQAIDFQRSRASATEVDRWRDAGAFLDRLAAGDSATTLATRSSTGGQSPQAEIHQTSRRSPIAEAPTLLRSRIPMDRRPVAAVVAVRNNSFPSETDRTMGEVVRGDIVKTGVFTVVERKNVDEILKEVQFQKTGLTESKNLAQLGRMLNATLVVTITAGKLGESFLLTITVTETSSGRVSYSDSQQFESLEMSTAASVILVNRLVQSEFVSAL